MFCLPLVASLEETVRSLDSDVDRTVCFLGLPISYLSSDFKKFSWDGPLLRPAGRCLWLFTLVIFFLFTIHSYHFNWSLHCTSIMCFWFHRKMYRTHFTRPQITALLRYRTDELEHTNWTDLGDSLLGESGQNENVTFAQWPSELSQKMPPGFS